MRLLEEDLRERPFSTLKERRDYVGVTTGLCVAKDTVFILWSRRKLLSTFRTHATQTVLPAYAMVPPRIIAQPPPLKG